MRYKNPILDNPLLLFDISAYARLEIPVEQEFKQNNVDLLAAFPGIVERSFERLHKEVLAAIEIESRDKNLVSVVVSGFIRGELIRLFPNLCLDATPQRFKLRGANGECIYVKKLDYHRRPMNVDTVSNEKIINQVSDSKSSGNIFLGYTAEELDVTGIYAVCIDGEEEKWGFDLVEFAAKNVSTKALTYKKEPELKEGIVELKKKKID